MTATVYFDEHGELIEPVQRHETRCARDPHRHERAVDPESGIQVCERPSRVEIQFDRAAVSPVALTGLMIWLNERWEKPITIMREDRVHVDVLRNRRDAMAYFSDLIDRRRAAPLLMRREAVLEQSPFATVWRAAQELCRATDVPKDARLRILNQLFAGVFCLNTFHRDDQCRVSAMGSEISHVDPEFGAVGIGKTHREMSDRAYGHWIADTFDSYFVRDQAFVECVDATIAFPRRRGRMRYTRLVVPFQSQDQRHLLVASDAQTDFRRRAGAM